MKASQRGELIAVELPGVIDCISYSETPVTHINTPELKLLDPGFVRL